MFQLVRKHYVLWTQYQEESGCVSVVDTNISMWTFLYILVFEMDVFNLTFFSIPSGGSFMLLVYYQV
jgi:hypothetical protein